MATPENCILIFCIYFFLPVGNSSQLTDGAAAVLLASRSAARRYGLPVLGVMRSFAVVGVPPDVMGIGPAHAIPEALARAGKTHGSLRRCVEELQ